MSGSRVASGELRWHAEALRLLHSVAATANEAETLSLAFPRALRLIAEFLDWPVAQAYVLDHPGADSVSGEEWYLADRERFAAFERAGRGGRFGAGQALPGMSPPDRMAACCERFADQAPSPRRDAAAATGLKCGLAIPIVAGSSVVGIMEFFSNKTGLPRPRVLDTLSQAAIHLGRVWEREQAAARIRESERRFDQMADWSPVIIWMSGLDGGSTYISKGWLDFTGRSLEEQLGDGWTRVIHADDVGQFVETYRNAFRRQAPFQGEFRIPRQDGEYRWMLSSGQPRFGVDGAFLGYIGSCVDITERKQGEVALELRETHLRLLLAQMPAALWATDSQLRVTSASGSGLAIAGPKPDQASGVTVNEFLRPLDPEAASLEAHRRALTGLSSRFELTTEDRTLEIHVEPLRDGAGSVLGTIGVAVDLTESRKTQEKLNQSRERLQALSRQLLEAQEIERRAIARGLHDEIGQLMTAMKLNLQAMRRHASTGPLEALLEESIGLVERGIHQVRTLSLDIRPPMLDDLGLPAAVRWYVDRQARRASFKATVEARVERRLPQETETAAFRIVQEAVTNVVRHARAESLRVRLEATGGTLDLVVHDDGAGFDASCSRLLLPTGANLGLVGMNELVELVGGELRITSLPERGTVVHARFPIPLEYPQ